MVSLYNCKHSGDQYRITKFDSDWNVEASYLCDLHACDCPAGHRPRCRHREMLPKFIQRDHVGDEWFYDHDRGGWVQGASKDIEPSHIVISDADGLEDEAQYDGDVLGTEESLASTALPLQQGFDRAMQAALEADGEKLRQLTDEDHGPSFELGTPSREPSPEQVLDKAMGADADSWERLENALAPAGLGQVSDAGHSSDPDLENIVWLPPHLYDEAVKEGHDMRYYRKQELIPIEPSPSIPRPTIRRRV